MSETIEEDLTTKQLTKWANALGSAVEAQQPVNQAVYDRMNIIEQRIERIEDIQAKALDILAGDRI